MLVAALRPDGAEVDAFEPRLVCRKQLAWLADAVVILGTPQQEVFEDSIAGADPAVAATAVLPLVEERQRAEAVRLAQRELRTLVAEQLQPALDRATTVAVEDQEGVVGRGLGPRDPLGPAVAVDVEEHPVLGRAEVETAVAHAEQDG